MLGKQCQQGQRREKGSGAVAMLGTKTHASDKMYLRDTATATWPSVPLTSFHKMSRLEAVSTIFHFSAPPFALCSNYGSGCMYLVSCISRSDDSGGCCPISGSLLALFVGIAQNTFPRSNEKMDTEKNQANEERKETGMRKLVWKSSRQWSDLRTELSFSVVYSESESSRVSVIRLRLRSLTWKTFRVQEKGSENKEIPGH